MKILASLPGTVVLAVVCFSCAAVREAGNVIPMTPEVREILKSDGHIDNTSPSPAEERKRLHRILNTSRAVGNRSGALEAARRILNCARMNMALVNSQDEGASARRGAAADLARARELAVEVGTELADPHLVLGAIGVPEGKDQYTQAFLKAAGRVPVLYRQKLYEAAYRLAEGRPDIQAQLERRYGGDQGPHMTLEALAGLGPRAIDLMERRLLKAVEERRLNRMTTIAEKIIEVDPLHIRARLAILWKNEVDHKRLPEDERCLDDIMGRSRMLGAMSRVEKACKKNPEAASVKLALTYLYSRADLVGDADVVVQTMLTENTWSDRVLSLAEAVQALLWLQSGDVDKYRVWAVGNRAKDSPFFNARESEFAGSENPEQLRELSREAIRVSFERGYRTQEGLHPWSQLVGVATNSAVADAIRKKAIEQLSYEDYAAAVVIRSCILEDLEESSCRERLDAAVSLGYAEDAESILEALSKVDLRLGISDNWGWYFPDMDKKQLAELGAILSKYEDSWVSTTQTYLLARIVVALSCGDLRSARSMYLSNRSLLSPLARVMVRLALKDLERQNADVNEVIKFFWTPDWPPSSLRWTSPASQTPEAVKRVDEVFSGDTLSSAFARVHSHWREGNVQAAYRDLMKLAGRLDGEEGEILDGCLALAAHFTGALKDRPKLQNTLGSIAGKSELNRLLAAEQALDGKDFELALKSYAWFLRRYPAASTHHESYLLALAGLRPGKLGVSIAVRWIEQTGFYYLSWLKDAVTSGGIADGSMLYKHLLAAHDGKKAWELGVSGENKSTWVNLASRWIMDRIAEASSAENAVQLAHRAAESLRTSKNLWNQRFLLAWALFLAGDGEAARKVALSKDTEMGSEPMDAWMPLPALSSARERGLIDHQLAFRLWKFFVREQGKQVDIARSLVARVPEPGSGLRVACRLLVDADLADQAIDICMRAWNEGRADNDLATAITWLFTARNAEVQKAGINPEDFISTAKQKLAGEMDGGWLYNAFLWHSDNGDYQKAADEAKEAFAKGYEPGSLSLEEDQMQVIEYAGPVMRYLIVKGAQSKRCTGYTSLATLSLAGGDMAACEPYLVAAGKWCKHGKDREELVIFETMSSFAEIARRDLKNGVLDRQGLALYFREAAETGMPTENFISRYPESALARTTRLVKDISGLRLQKALQAGRDLLGEFPENAILVHTVAQLLAATGSMSEAHEILQRARKSHPGSLLLNDPSLAHIAPQKQEERCWLEDLDAYNKAIGEVSRQDIMRLNPVRRTSIEEGIEAFFPAGSRKDIARDFSYLTPKDLLLSIRSVPLSAKCEATACLDPLIPVFQRVGFSVVWKRPVRIPAGDSAEALFRAQGSQLLIVAVPTGGRLYLLHARGPDDAVSGSLAEVKLLQQGFRPLDSVLPADRAEELRNGFPKDMNDRLRLLVRMGLSEKPTEDGCPITSGLEAAPSVEMQSALLLDAYLAEPSEEKRRRLLCCTEPGQETSKRLGVVSLLDDDPGVYDFGIRTAREFPKQTLDDARVALQASSNTKAGERGGKPQPGLPAYGWLQVLSALPGEQKKELADGLFRSLDSSQRALGIMAGGFFPEAAKKELLRSEVINSPPGWAQLAATVVLSDPDAEDMRAVRKRLDALEAPLDRANRRLLEKLAFGLANEFEPKDSKRMDRSVELCVQGVSEEDREDARRFKKLIEWYRDIHERGAQILKKYGKALPSEVPTARDQKDAIAWNGLLKKRTGVKRVPVPLDKLQSLGLARLLDGATCKYRSRGCWERWSSHSSPGFRPETRRGRTSSVH